MTQKMEEGVMMDDRELLDLAAKAAGYSGQWDATWWGMCDGENFWDPLRHNGQALRLAVKLQLGVVPYDGGTSIDPQEDHISPGIWEAWGSDPFTATRRAIVRAAAAIATQGDSSVR